MRKITKLEPAAPILKPKKRVAAYARVSMESERLQHSLSAQISYYNEKIQKNPDWLFAGVYADNGISGTGTVDCSAHDDIGNTQSLAIRVIAAFELVCGSCTAP
jgi:hypothetical protein